MEIEVRGGEGRERKKGRSRIYQWIKQKLALEGLFPVYPEPLYSIKNELMKNLLNYIESRFPLTNEDISSLEKCFITVKVPAQTKLLEAGKIGHYVYFLSSGIVKGYQNIDGKLVIQHLVSEQDFFTSLESFMSKTPSLDYYEAITDCKLVKIAKPDLELLQKTTSFWSDIVATVTNEHLNCKLERIKDLQILTAKERYLKFLNQHPKFALQVSVDNIASFLGMEPQSLSRIRKQITF